MKWFGVLVITLISVFNAAVVEGSSSSSSKKSSTKKSLKSTFSSPTENFSLEKSNYKDIFKLADVAFALSLSAIKKSSADVDHLLIDFEELSQDSSYPCDLFLPETTSFVLKSSWSAPLESNRIDINLMNLEGKLNSISNSMKDELFDHAGSLSWVSNGNLIVGYIAIVSTTISKLNYLISRLRNSPNFPENSKLKLYSIVYNHLRGLAGFCENIMSYSGKFGMTFDRNKLNDPSRFFEHLFDLRSESGIGMTDEIFEILIKFFFDAYAAEFYEKITEIFLKNTRSDLWAPLPIEYLRNRMCLESPEKCEKFVDNWKQHVFTGSDFDSRHLVNLGRLMQQGMISYDSLRSIIRILNLSFTSPAPVSFDSNMVEFLTLSASTPWLLPSDHEAAILIGDFSSPYSKIDVLTDIEKIQIIEEIFEAFAGPANFTLIQDAEYENLCKLIQRLDMAYPGISQKLWSHVNGLAGLEPTKQEEFYLATKSKIETYTNYLTEFADKASFLRDQFDGENVLKNVLVDTRTLYLLLEFYTDVLVEALEAIEGVDAYDETDENLMSIFDSFLNFFDTFLRHRAHKTVINFFFTEYDFIPTRIFDAFIEYCHINIYSVTIVDKGYFMITKNISKLVDHNLIYARAFMTMLQSKANKHKELNYLSVFKAPKCLIENGEIDSYAFSYIEALLNIDEHIVHDEFFSILSEKLAVGVVSFESAERLLQELLDNETLKFDVSEDGFISFWSPFLIINLARKIKSRIGLEEEDRIKNVFKLYMSLVGTKSEEIGITTLFVRGISNFVGFFQLIKAEIDENCKSFSPDVYDKMHLTSKSSESDFQNLAILFVGIFQSIITKGVRIEEAQKILQKLLNIAQVLISNNFQENSHLNDLILAFNCLLVPIMRIPSISLPDEEKWSIVIYNLFKNHQDIIPNFKINLINNLKKVATISKLYLHIIKSGDFLPENAFDVLLANGKRNEVNAIQLQYMGMIVSRKQLMDMNLLNPITSWIRDGVVNSSALLKLLKAVGPDLDFRVTLNFLPLIIEFVKSYHYSNEIKVAALVSLFSTSNVEMIRNLSNRRTSIFHESFLELFAIQPSEPVDKFLELCTDTDWKEGLMVEIARYTRNISTNNIYTSKYTSNLSTLSDIYLKELLSIVNDPVPNYEVRLAVTLETNLMASKFLDILPILRDNSITNGPLQQCVSFMISSNLQLNDGPISFFKVYATQEGFVPLFQIQDLIFKRNPRKTHILNGLLDSIVSPSARRSIIESISRMVTINSFILNATSFKMLYPWFNPEGAANFNDFLCALVSFTGSKILEGITSERAPVLDQIFSTFSELFTSNFGPIIKNQSIHNEVLNMVKEVMTFNKDFIGKSVNILEYLKHVVEHFSFDSTLMQKIDSILKEFPEFYLRNKIYWILIWKKLHISNPFNFYGDLKLNVFLTLGTSQLSDWTPDLINYIPKMGLPQRVIASILIDLSHSSSKFNLQILQILPDDLLFDEFGSSDEIDGMTKFLTKSLRLMEKSNFLSSKTFEKFLVLLRFDVKVGKRKNWTWRRIFRLIDSNFALQSHFIKTLYEMDKKVLASSFVDSNDVLKFIFELNLIKKNGLLVGHKVVVDKLVEIYNQISGNNSSIPDSAELKLYESISEQVVSLKDTLSGEINESDVMAITEFVKQFGSHLDSVATNERQDSFALSSISYVLIVAVQLFKCDLSKINSDLLNELCDLMVSRIYSVLLLGDNLVALALSFDEVGLEAFVMFIGDYVEEKVPEFDFIIGQLMKFAEYSVSDLFYQQISDGNLRVDICQITEEMIRNFDTVTAEGFKEISDEVWPNLYLNCLIEFDAVFSIHGDHFKRIWELIQHFVDDLLDYSTLFEKLGILMSRTESISDILALIELILDDEIKVDCFSMKELYTNLLTESNLKSILNSNPSESKKQFIKFLKKMKEKHSVTFSSWFQADIKPEMRKLISKTLEADFEASKANVHTSITTRIIQIIGETKFDDPSKLEHLMTNFKNLDMKIVSVCAANQLSSVLIKVLEDLKNLKDPKWIVPMQNCLKFLLTFPQAEIESESENYGKLFEIARSVFSSELLQSFVELAKSEEALMAVLNNFSSKIDVSHWKIIKNRLRAYNLQDDRDILLMAARNSDSMQLLEFYRNQNTLTVEEKLDYLNVCSRANHLNAEKVGTLINYYQNLLQHNSVDVKKIILKGILNNATIMTSFTNLSKSSSKNKSTILTLLKANLGYEESKRIEGDIENLIGKMVLNFYFAPSSAKSSIIPSEAKEDSNELIVNFFNSLINELVVIQVEGKSMTSEESKSQTRRVFEFMGKIKNKIPILIKSFKLYEEIDRRGIVLPISTLDSMTLALYDNLQPGKSSSSFGSSPQAIFAIAKLTRRLLSRKMERYHILKSFLSVKPKTARIDCYQALLDAQVLSGNIDWEFQEYLQKKTTKIPRIQELLKDFEIEYKTNVLK